MGAATRVCRVLPAHERLDAQDVPRPQVHQRLVVQYQLAIGGGGGDIASQGVIVSHGRIQGRVVAHDAAFAVPLGGVHGQIGLVH